MSTPTPTTTAGESALMRTPFHQFHLDHGAKMVPFAGWEMPIAYGSIIEEHKQVRASGGLFDVSHMGRLRFTGRDCCRFLDRVCTRQIHGMPDGSARYSFICNEQGGCRDDVLVYRIKESEFVMVCNASNREKLLGWFDQVRGDLKFKLADETLDTAMVALQGPRVIDLLSNFSTEIPELKRFRFTVKNLLIAKVLISRTGYTGEDGVEIIMPAKFASMAFDLLMKHVEDADLIKPTGLGARDSLRLEAAMPLYGHELTEDRDVMQTGLGFAMKLNKAGGSEGSPPEVGRFIGQDALEEIAAAGGPKQMLIGLELEGRRAARQNMPVLHADDDRAAGVITSGCWSPTLGKSIAMAYVNVEVKEPGTSLRVDLGRAVASATVVALPFYKA